MTPLLVFSHLRWDFVYQRPQHLLSRMSAQRPVIYVEEPMRADGADRLEVREAAPGVTVVRPLTDRDDWGFSDGQLERIRPLLMPWLREHGAANPIVWLYTAMAWPVLEWTSPRLVVYDCMDELSAFLGAPPELLERERQLLARADIVSTGGPSLYEAKRQSRPDALCLPSSVDAAHFARAGAASGDEQARTAASLQGALPRPLLGFFGVIDERMDLALVDHLATARPQWSIVMAGPVVKIDPAARPTRPNLHWLGQQPYARLPHLLADWSVALMPFALNESTRFISPTKTLEYMAGGIPVVSTRVRDVVSLYGEGVQIADSPQAFVDCCDRLLNAGQTQRQQQAVVMARLVERSSWDRTAAALADAIAQRLSTAPAGAVPAPHG